MLSHICSVVVVTCSLLAGRGILSAQQQLNWWADDAKRVESLERSSGTRMEGRHVILWFPPSLPRADAEALTKRLDPAVEALRRRIGVHDWQAVPKGKITYYIHDDAFVAHGSGRGAVFVPMARVKDGRAPFLHEATHEILASNRIALARAEGGRSDFYPLWLTEGLADYLARLAAVDAGITEEGPFGTPDIASIDSVCAARARTLDGATMLPFVGTDALPEALFTSDRRKYAPTFYACSFSFTKYLAERLGLEALINLFALNPRDAITRLDTLAGRPLSLIVAGWRTQLGLR